MKTTLIYDVPSLRNVTAKKNELNIHTLDISALWQLCDSLSTQPAISCPWTSLLYPHFTYTQCSQSWADLSMWCPILQVPYPNNTDSPTLPEIQSLSLLLTQPVLLSSELLLVLWARRCLRQECRAVPCQEQILHSRSLWCHDSQPPDVAAFSGSWSAPSCSHTHGRCGTHHANL